MNMTHGAHGCPFIANVDGEAFVIDGFMKDKGYGDECKTIYFAGVALFQDEENKENGNLVFQFCFEYSYDTDEYKCYSKHFSDEIVENDFAYFIVENYEQSCRNVKEVLKRRERKRVLATVYVLVLWYISVRYKTIYERVSFVKNCKNRGVCVENNDDFG